MKHAVRILAAAAVASFSGLALAQAQAPAKASPFYVEGAYAAVKFEGEEVSITPKIVRGILGYEAHPNLAVEAILGFGVSDGTRTVEGVSAKLSIDNMLGLAIRPKIDLTPEFEVFARAGVARVKQSAKLEAKDASDVYSISASETETNPIFGLGAAYKVNASVSIVADYMSYYDKHNVTGKGFSLGVRYRF